MCAVRRVLLGIGLPALPWGTALALIDISPKVSEVKDGQAVVQVINTGDTPEFVNITLYLVTNPGVPSDEEQTIPLGLVKQPSLYATPFKLSLGPRQQKQVQLKVLREIEQEKVYRLAVIPQQKANISGTKNNVMLVGLGYMGLVRQLPLIQTVAWHHRCEARGPVLEATGTVRAAFTELKRNGRDMGDFNLYPGAPRVVDAQVLSGKVEGKPFSVKCGD
ncbi:hypothetical protein Z042_01860 [Chania multitudinisentens RB-25]|uniref:Pilus assembly protein n=2 Tax=Chania TaxID=1745211 RepID=W0L806_9GAMM|nr:hypothetical protein Z042_01860 [Chania multitudinisentens RB-25]